MGEGRDRVLSLEVVQRQVRRLTFRRKKATQGWSFGKRGIRLRRVAGDLASWTGRRT